MDATLTLPWWVPVGFLLLLLTFLKPRSGREMRRYAVRLGCRLRRWGRVCERHCRVHAQRASGELERYFTHRANQRLRLGLLDYEDLVKQQHADVRRLCTEAHAFVRRLDEEVDASVSEPPEAPQWVAAVQAVAELPADHQRNATVEILQQALQTARRQHEEAMREYRWAAAVRHRTLAAQVSIWRRLQRRIRTLEGLLRNLDQHSVALHGAAAACAVRRNASLRRRAATVLFRFVLAALVLVVGVILTRWNAELFFIKLLHSGVGAVESRLLAGIYTVSLLLLGAVAVCALRWSVMLAPIAALKAAPRRRVLFVSLAGLVLLAAVGMQESAEHVSSTLAAAAWPPFLAGFAGLAVVAAPLLTALLSLAIEELLRAGRPLAGMAAQRMLGRAAVALGWLGGVLEAGQTDAKGRKARE